MNVNEARSNPHLNPKLTFSQLVHERYKSALNQGVGKVAGTTNLFLSFSHIEKLGINPHPVDEDDTPSGVYAYPIEYVIEEIGNNGSSIDLPYAGHFKYVNFFSLRGDVYDVNNTPANVQQEVINNCKEILKMTSSWEYIQPESLDFRERNWFIILVEYSRGLASVLKTKPAVAMNKILKVSGVDALIDFGKSTIHVNEPVQAVVLNTKSITNVYRTTTPKGDVDRNLEVKYGKHRTETPEKMNVLVFKDLPIDKQTDYIVKKNRSYINFLNDPRRGQILNNEGWLFEYIRDPSPFDLCRFVVWTKKYDENRRYIRLINYKHLDLFDEIDSWLDPKDTFRLKVHQQIEFISAIVSVYNEIDKRLFATMLSIMPNLLHALMNYNSSYGRNLAKRTILNYVNMFPESVVNRARSM